MALVFCVLKVNESQPLFVKNLTYSSSVRGYVCAPASGRTLMEQQLSLPKA